MADPFIKSCNDQIPLSPVNSNPRLKLKIPLLNVRDKDRKNAFKAFLAGGHIDCRLIQNKGDLLTAAIELKRGVDGKNTYTLQKLDFTNGGQLWKAVYDPSGKFIRGEENANNFTAKQADLEIFSPFIFENQENIGKFKIPDSKAVNAWVDNILKILEGPKDFDIKLREGHRLLRILFQAHYLSDNQDPIRVAEVFHNKEISEKISTAYNYTESLFILNRQSDPDGVKFINSYALRERELKLKH